MKLMTVVAFATFSTWLLGLNARRLASLVERRQGQTISRGLR